VTREPVSEHYRSGPLGPRVRAALAAAGLDRPGVSFEAFAPIDEFHVGGLEATRELARALAPQPGDSLLDLGSGLGGPARLLAAERDCDVTGVDLSDEFVAAASTLTSLAGLDQHVRFQTGDVTALPFADASFEHAVTIHVAMNIADRAEFYTEARRILRPGGRLAILDVVAADGDGESLTFPLPWSTTAATSHLLTRSDTIAELDRAGFETVDAVDRTAWSLAWFAAQGRAAAAAGAPPPLGLQVVMGERFATMGFNLVANLTAGRVGVAQIVATRAER
jgi:cyclopropane fatty-acyl-phospholipid synthase-like methyltransferase